MAHNIPFRPLGDRILVRRDEPEEKTSKGLLLPDTAKEKPIRGTVVAVGPGTRGEDGKAHPIEVKEGDKIYITKWSGTEIKIEGQEYLVIKESDILGIMTA